MHYLTDTHCHLYLKDFAQEFNAIIERALQRGVSRILIPGIDLETSYEAIKMSESHPGLFAAVGVHPHNASFWDNDHRSELREMAKHPRVVAIGETGLDYYRDRSPRLIQREVFHEHLTIAAEVGKPIIIHNREATYDLLPDILEWRSELSKNDPGLAQRVGVLHSFGDTQEIAQVAIENGFYLGISGPVTYTNAQKRQDMISALPLESMILETDAPYLTPSPHRGQRNEPAYISYIAEKMAILHHKDVEDVSEITSTNAQRLFQWGEVN